MRPVRQTVLVLSAAGLLVSASARAAQPSRTSSPARRLSTASPARKPAPKVTPASKVTPAVKKAPPRPLVASTAPLVTVTPAPIDPTRNLALFGITQVGDTPQAWLIDLTSHQREPAGPGDEAFGFTVKQVGTDRVTLARAGREFVLRLGQKHVPAAGEPVPPARALPAERWQRPAPVAAQEEDERPLPVVERLAPGPSDPGSSPASENGPARRAGTAYRQGRSGPFSGGYTPSPGPNGYPEESDDYPGYSEPPYPGYPEESPAEEGYPGSSVRIRPYGTAAPRLATSGRRGTMRRARPGIAPPPTPQTARRRGDFRGDSPEEGAPAPIVNPQTLRRQRATPPGPPY